MLKKILIIGAIIAVIPLERENQADLYRAAKSTVSDISGFCARNPLVCEKGNVALNKLATKAEFGARMVVDIAKEHSGPGADQVTQLLRSGQFFGSASQDSPELVASSERFPAYRDKQYSDHYGSPNNTLSSSDLQPDWRGENN